MKGSVHNAQHLFQVRITAKNKKAMSRLYLYLTKDYEQTIPLPSTRPTWPTPTASTLDPPQPRTLPFSFRILLGRGFLSFWLGRSCLLALPSLTASKPKSPSTLEATATYCHINKSNDEPIAPFLGHLKGWVSLPKEIPSWDLSRSVVLDKRVS